MSAVVNTLEWDNYIARNIFEYNNKKRVLNSQISIELYFNVQLIITPWESGAQLFKYFFKIHLKVSC